MKIDFIKSLCCLKELPLDGFTILELKRTGNDSFVEHMSQNAWLRYLQSLIMN